MRLLLPLLFSLLAGSAAAHPGGVDANGCHKDRATGQTHCHPERARGAARAAKAAQRVRGKVVRVLDGDTLEVLDAGRTRRIRLFGVDCPEKSQPFGGAAKRRASSLVSGKIVAVEIVDSDRYGRSVGKVFLEGGRMLNEELVRSGMAWWYRRYDPVDARLQALETEAREAKRGLWSTPSPEEPWLFRASKRKTPPSI